MLKDYFMLGILEKLYPTFRLIDTKRVKVVETTYGKFNYTKTLQLYYNLFEQIDDYDFSDLNSDDVVLDLGACIGASTIRMAKIAKSVIAVEPLFFDELEENIQLNHLKNVKCLPYALNDTGVKYAELSFAGKTEFVTSASMEKILNNCPVRPTFLKTDCEGGEQDIQPEHLGSIRAIEAEVHNFGGYDPMTFVNMLIGLGFSVKYTKTSESQLMVHARRKL
jgi:FkbM family methyltransferase